MALTKVTTGTPIKVTGTTASSVSIIESQINLKFVWWYNPTTAGDLLTVTDSNGKEMAQLRCEENGKSEFLPVFVNCTGVYVSDMDSGTLYIYY